jgi:hypothetical protein
MLYLDRKPVFQAIDKAIGFNIARFIKDISAKITWDII